MSNNSNFTAATCRDAVFHTTPTPTVCYSVPSIVEVSGGCQSVNMSAPKPLARNGNFFKNAVINIFFTVTSKMAQLHIFRGLWFRLA